jgi:site-specific DNA-methyltransferase (adenine-specific)
MVEVFREVKRLLKDDGTLWLNLGDSYARQAGSDKTKEADSGMKTGRTGRAKMLFKEGANKPPDGLKAKDLVGIPWRVAFALQSDGWYLRQDIIWHKPNPMPESVTDRCTKAHEYVFLLSKSERYYYSAEAVSEASKYPEDNRKARQKASDYESMMGNSGQIRAVINPKGARSYPTRNRRSVWTITTKPYSGAHFAVMPADLAKPCIMAGCREGGVVLDPFSGSGTTAMVARDLSCRYVGIELNPEYVEISLKRLEQGVLF